MMYSPMRHITSIFWKRKPIQLTFFVTRKCNASCPFCFYLKGKDSEHSLSELSIDEIEKISLSLGRLLWVLFSGGEPYLREDIVEISRVFYKNNRPSILTYPTNGLLPQLIRDRTEDILRFCRKSVVSVKLSLDLIGEDHDRLRGVKDSFRRLMQTYEVLCTLLDRYPNFELGINTIFFSENQNSIETIIEFVNRLDGIKTHTLSMIRGDIKNWHYRDIDLQLYHNAIRMMERNLKMKVAGIYRFKGARVKAAQDILQRRLIYQTMLKKRRLIPCYAGRLNIVLTEAGDVYPCELLGDKIGNLREYNYNIVEMLRSANARRIIADIKNGGCYCSHECYFMTNILFNPRMYPAIIKEYLQL